MSKNLIVVDVQPFYEPYIPEYVLENVAEKIKEADNVYFYYNGSEVCIDDTPHDIMFMFEELELINEDDWSHVTFVEKEYAFLRSWMDEGVDDDEILDCLSKMKKSGVYSSLDMEEYEDRDQISNPEYTLPYFRKSQICGGGEYECLKEMELWLTHKGISVEKVDSCVY